MGNACSLHFFYCATTTASLSASASPINTQQSMIITFAIIFGVLLFALLWFIWACLRHRAARAAAHVSRIQWPFSARADPEAQLPSIPSPVARRSSNRTGTVDGTEASGSRVTAPSARMVFEPLPRYEPSPPAYELSSGVDVSGHGFPPPYTPTDDGTEPVSGDGSDDLAPFAMGSAA